MSFTYDEEDDEEMKITMEEKGFKLTQLEIGGAEDENGVAINWRPVPTTIWEAARQGDHDKIMMITLSRTDANKKNPMHETPLHYAKGELCTKMLLECGAMKTINAVDKQKRTPLMNAAIRKDEGKTKVLIRWGANPMLKDDNKKTAFDYAYENKAWKIVELIKESERLHKIGVEVFEGGILGEKEEDRKAKLLAEDAAYKKAKALTLHGKDRATSYPSWMRKEIWAGAFEPLLGEEGTRLLKHFALWSPEEFALFLATDETLNGLEDNVQDYCKRVRDARIGGRVFHGLTKYKQAELLTCIEIPVKHKRFIINRML